MLADELPAVSRVVLAAFGAAEGEVLVRLIGDLVTDVSAQPVVSLVACVDEKVVGHILFSKAKLGDSSSEVSAALLAPLAVHPDCQSMGIGGELIADGLQRLERLGVDLVFVLGYPGYYTRYGFVEAGVNGFTAPYPILPKNAPAWMVQALRPGLLGSVSGRVECANALDHAKYWCE